MTTQAALSPTDGLVSTGVRIDLNDVERRVAVRGRRHVSVLNDVTLTIGAGELVAIVGPSGAGKTMLLETIAGIAPASSGSVSFDGTDLHANLKAFRGLI